MIRPFTRQNAANEIRRLTAVSERQSRMLARALKEKNDLVQNTQDNGYERSRYYEKQAVELQLALSEAHTRLRDIKSHAVLLFKGLEIL